MKSHYFSTNQFITYATPRSCHAEKWILMLTTAWMNNMRYPSTIGNESARTTARARERTNEKLKSSFRKPILFTWSMHGYTIELEFPGTVIMIKHALHTIIRMLCLLMCEYPKMSIVCYGDMCDSDVDDRRFRHIAVLHGFERQSEASLTLRIMVPLEMIRIQQWAWSISSLVCGCSFYQGKYLLVPATFYYVDLFFVITAHSTHIRYIGYTSF